MHQKTINKFWILVHNVHAEVSAFALKIEKNQMDISIDRTLDRPMNMW